MTFLRAAQENKGFFWNTVHKRRRERESHKSEKHNIQMT